MTLFENVLYHVSQSLSEETRTEISRILHFNGAVETSLKNATHVISNTIEFEGCDTLAQNVVCVTVSYSDFHRTEVLKDLSFSPTGLNGAWSWEPYKSQWNRFLQLNLLYTGPLVLTFSPRTKHSFSLE